MRVEAEVRELVRKAEGEVDVSRDAEGDEEDLAACAASADACRVERPTEAVVVAGVVEMGMDAVVLDFVDEVVEGGATGLGVGGAIWESIAAAYIVRVFVVIVVIVVVVVVVAGVVAVVVVESVIDSDSRNKEMGYSRRSSDASQYNFGE